MDTDVTAYPICWPAGRQRTKTRQRANFCKIVRREGQSWESREKLSIEQARVRVTDELRRLGARKPIISSNLELRNDGLPRSGQRQPADPGVAVYFDLNGGQKCIAIDLWDRVEDNLVAVAKSIDAMRGLERWGGAQIVAAVFTGFKALPGGDAIVTPMTVEQADAFLLQIAKVDAPFLKTGELIEDRNQFEAAYRIAVRHFHPDRNGGTQHPQWQTLQDAADILSRHHGI